MDRLVEKALAQSQSLRIAKFQIKPTWSPDITIARDPGSGGQLVAQKVAQKLGWQLFDKSLMLKLSDQLGIPAAEFAHVDEHSRSWLADWFNSIFNPDYVSDIRYISHLKKLLAHASKKKDLVILGRGANLILPHDKCLRVRITASFSTRVSNTYKYEHKSSKKEAADWVRHVENQRNQFIRQYFGANPHNPWHYDLVISTDHLSLSQAADLIVQAYYTKFPGEKRRLKTKI